MDAQCFFSVAAVNRLNSIQFFKRKKLDTKKNPVGRENIVKFFSNELS